MITKPADEDIRRMTDNPTSEDLWEMADSYVNRGIIDSRLFHAYPRIFAQALLERMDREVELGKAVDDLYTWVDKTGSRGKTVLTMPDGRFISLDRILAQIKPLLQPKEPT